MKSTPFTYYGDLLGVSNYYRIDPRIAKDKLNAFYNLVYSLFKNSAISKKVELVLFSDFIIVTGHSVETILPLLGKLYNDLIEKDIMIKGALVKGKLFFEKRLELKNLQKRLPVNDVLFRAVCIEKNLEGMCLAIEKPLAKSLLPFSWLTDEGYQNNPKIISCDSSDYRRKIALMRNWDAYEYLWPITWGLDKFNSEEYRLVEMKFNFTHIVSKMRSQLRQIPTEARKHYKSTIELYKKAEHRQAITQYLLN